MPSGRAWSLQGTVASSLSCRLGASKLRWKGWCPRSFSPKSHAGCPWAVSGGGSQLSGGYSRLDPLPGAVPWGLFWPCFCTCARGHLVTDKPATACTGCGYRRENGETVVGPGSSQAMGVHLLWRRGLSLSAGCWPCGKSTFLQEVLKNFLRNVNPGKAVGVDTWSIYLLRGRHSCARFPQQLPECSSGT